MDIQTLLSTMEARGWELSLFPVDWLNPSFGWTCQIRMPADNKDGYVDINRTASTPHGALGLVLVGLKKSPGGSLLPE